MKTTIVTRSETKSSERHPVAGGEASIVSMRCPDKATPNEDAAAIIDVDGRRAVLAVADGMGGRPAGADAAELTLRLLAESVREHAGDETLRTAVMVGIDRANTEVMAFGVNAGTTVAVVEVDGRTLRSYHVGDSMILLVGQRGRRKLQTVAHSPVGYAVEAGFLDEQEAMHHEERHVVSNIVGSPEMRIDVGPTLTMAERDTVVVASDGLMDNLHVSEVTEMIRKGPIDRAADALAAETARRMTEPTPGLPSKPDDATFIIFRPRGSADRSSRSAASESDTMPGA